MVNKEDKSNYLWYKSQIIAVICSKHTQYIKYKQKRADKNLLLKLNPGCRSYLFDT